MAFTGQLFKFPAAAHDDMVDAFVMGLLYLERFLEEGWRARVRSMVGGSL